MGRAIRSALPRSRKRRPGSAALSSRTTRSIGTALGLLPPVVAHHGQAAAASAARQQTLDAAYARHPERFVGGRPVPPLVPGAVWINAPRPQQETLVTVAATEAAVPADEPASRVSAAAAA